METIKRIVECNDTPWGRAFDLIIQALIVVSLVTFSVETLPNLSERARHWLYAIEVVTVGIFTVEYVLRLAVADKKFRFAVSFFGLIDLMAILPFYVATGVDLRAIRAFRFLRLFRAFKVVRYSKAIQRYHRAFTIAKEEIVLFFIVAMMMIYFAAVGIYYFENEAQPDKFTSVFHSLWWSISTLTTVGYGDVYPVTVGGKVFTALVLIIGLGIVAVPAGLLASALSKARDLDE